jgi:hypothetical protein
MTRKQTEEPLTGRNAAQRIAKVIRSEFHDRGAHEVFSDWVTMCCMTLANATGLQNAWMRDDAWQERESTFLKTQQRYQSKTQRDAFGRMLGMLMSGAAQSREQGEFPDILGDTFEALELMNEYAGQFFTPQDVARLMVLQTVDEAFLRGLLETQRYVTVCDPCVGSARTLLPVVELYHRCRIDWTHHLLLHGDDLDWRCVCMTYVTLSLYDVPAIVRHMNTLSNDVYCSLRTPVVQLRGFWFAKRQRAFAGASEASASETSSEGAPSATNVLPAHVEQVAKKTPVQFRLF